VHDQERAPPRVVYNTDHPMPWGWKVSTYFLTKGIAAGLVLAAAVAVLAGETVSSAWMRWGTPLIAGIFLVLTGVLLVADLKRPDRFYYLLTKGRPGSWLVRGAYILGAYAALLGAWFLAGITGADRLVLPLIWLGVPLALATAGYTAFLFGQAEARDLWQSPTLLWHMLAAAFAVGGGAALVVSRFMQVGEAAERAFAWSMLGGAAALGLIALAEIASRHPTRNVAAAMHHMTRGRYAVEWWAGGFVLGVVVPVIAGITTVVVGADAAWLGAVGGLAAAAGIWFSDDALVKAGQSVPLS
jgi:predicted membrane protein